MVPLLSELIAEQILEAAVLGFQTAHPESTAGLVQADGRMFPSIPAQRHQFFWDYCQLIRKTERGQLACEICDVCGVRNAVGGDSSRLESPIKVLTNDVHSPSRRYVCHAGNVELIVPVRLYLGAIGGAPSAHVGAFWCGQIRSSHGEEVTEGLGERIGIPMPQLHSAREKRSILSEEKINSYEADLVRMADAISRAASEAYRLREHRRASQIITNFTRRITAAMERPETALSVVPLRSLLDQSMTEFVREYSLKSNTLFLIRPDGSGRVDASIVASGTLREDRTISPVSSRVSDLLRARSAGRVVPLAQGEFGDDALVRKAAAAANVDLACDAWYAACFATKRAGSYLWIIAEHADKSWQIRNFEFQESFQHVVELVGERLAGYLDMRSMLRDQVLRTKELETYQQQLQQHGKEIRELVLRMSHAVSRPILELAYAFDSLLNGGDDQARFHVESAMFELRIAARNFQMYERLSSSEIPSTEEAGAEVLDGISCFDAARQRVLPLAMIERRAVEIEIDDAMRKAPPRVRMRRNDLAEIIENLIHNAIKYSIGGREVRIELTNSTRGMVAKIINYGCAIGDDERDRIFDVRYRSPNAKTLVEEGAGLGLWVVRRLAQRAGITAEMVQSKFFDFVEDRVGTKIPRFRNVFRLWIPLYS
jgi:signal transduction histidine kinase/ligand-binding sensor protein